MASIKTYKDIVAWQRSRELLLLVYELIKKLPADEKYGLSSQMKRSAVSISSNIAEGFARNSVKESKRFYNIAKASLEELKSQFQICFDLEYLGKEDSDKVVDLMDYVGALIYKWSNSQEKNLNNSRASKTVN